MKRECPNCLDLVDSNDSDSHVALPFRAGLGELADKMGASIDLTPAIPSSCLLFRLPETLSDLRAFLETYRTEMLISRELPVICHAYKHASRNEVRELIVLDAEVGREPRFQSFAEASRNVGAAQLKRLRPLRDQRLVQRYLQAVESGEAAGWHTIVYGLILALYSLPLRQGLLNYGREATRGFIVCANSSLKLLEAQAQQLHEETCVRLPHAVESLLADVSLSVS